MVYQIAPQQTQGGAANTSVRPTQPQYAPASPMTPGNPDVSSYAPQPSKMQAPQYSNGAPGAGGGAYPPQYVAPLGSGGSSPGGAPGGGGLQYGTGAQQNQTNQGQGGAIARAPVVPGQPLQRGIAGPGMQNSGPVNWTGNLPSPQASGALWYPAAPSQQAYSSPYGSGLQQGGMRPMGYASPGSGAYQSPAGSIEQNSLSGGRSNAQSVQNLMQALRGAGAGSNNAAMNQGIQSTGASAPLLGPPVQSNGNAGQVSYNYGLGAQGGQAQFGTLNPSVGTGFNPNPYALGPGYATPAPQQQAGNPQGYNPQIFGNSQDPASAGQMPQYSGGYNGAAGLLASDENVKTSIEPGDQDIQRMLNSLNPHQYEYRDQKFGQGTHYSVMAQELEKSPVGRSMVEQGSDGVKRVNYLRGQAVQLAALAMLNQRLNRLEKKKGS